MSQTHTNELATNITARINVMEPVPNVDINYGPYASVHDAYETLNNVGAIAIGLTVGVTTENGIQEYWFKNGTTENDLVIKGALDYDLLDNKPKIENKTLDSTTTLAQIGAVSATTFDTHVNDKEIHTPFLFSADDARPKPVRSIIISGGNKLTIETSSGDYNFRLVQWKDIPDFFVFYGNVSSNLRDEWFFDTGASLIPYADVTVDDLFNLAQGIREREGYMATTEIPLETKAHGTITCSYVRELTRECNAVFILSRTTTEPIPVLNMMISTNILGDYVEYDITTSPNTDEFQPQLAKSNLVVGNDRYSLKVFVPSGMGSLAHNTIGIKFTIQ